MPKEMEFLRNEILKTGFPLELSVFSVLSSRSWVPYSHEYYFDYELKVAREIDIRANRFPSTYATNFEVHPSLAIECKKSSENAWVFFQTESLPVGAGRYLCGGQYADFIKSQKPEDFFFPSLHLLSDLPHYTKKALQSNSYTQIKLKKSQNRRRDRPRNEIFEAINQTSKYVSYEIESCLEGYREERMNILGCVFFLPIIVFDGKLFRATLKNQDVMLKRANHVVLTRFYKPKYALGRLPFFIDIVKKSYFSSYLSMIEEELENLNKNIEKMKDISKQFVETLGPENQI